MSTESQIRANRENAQLSTGPKTEAGKATAALNNTRHGLTGAFRILPTESQSDFDALLAAFREEHKPETVTETVARRSHGGASLASPSRPEPRTLLL